MNFQILCTINISVLYKIYWVCTKVSEAAMSTGVLDDESAEIWEHSHRGEKKSWLPTDRSEIKLQN